MKTEQITTDEHLLAVEGVYFFGEITASISHEIKNVLAILNENSGLLKDLLLLNSNGVPLDTERLERLSKSLDRQIKRADGIIKNMNQFAHSADLASESMDVGEVVLFMKNLGARLIQMRQAVFTFESLETPVRSYINRFFLENLVWRSMIRAMDSFNLASAIHIFVEDSIEGPRIRFTGAPDREKTSMETLLTSQENVLFQMLGARLSIDSEKGEIIILLPNK